MSAAADRGDHVDARARIERGVEPGALAVDVDVDVTAQGRAFRNQPIAEARPLLLELVERLRDRCRLDVEATDEPGEERHQRRREMDVRHQASIVATSTEEIAGR